MLGAGLLAPRRVRSALQGEEREVRRSDRDAVLLERLGSAMHEVVADITIRHDLLCDLATRLWRSPTTKEHQIHTTSRRNLQLVLVRLCAVQKIATLVFVWSSVLFGTLGIVMVLTGIDPDDNTAGVSLVITKALMCSIFVILTSFALSVASRFLDDNRSKPDCNGG